MVVKVSLFSFCHWLDSVAGDPLPWLREEPGVGGTCLPLLIILSAQTTEGGSMSQELEPVVTGCRPLQNFRVIQMPMMHPPFI